MRVLVCGDRNWTDITKVAQELSKFPVDGTVFIQGMCSGADLISRQFAIDNGYEVLDFPADWDKYGRRAGPIRNSQMLREGKPDRVIAFHSDLSKSKGTIDMVTKAWKAGLMVLVIK